MAFITRKITRTSQPQELVGIDRGNQICSGLAAAALPKATIGDGKHEVSGQLSGTDMKLSAGTHGIGVDGRVSSKNSFRLHSVSNHLTRFGNHQILLVLLRRYSCALEIR